MIRKNENLSICLYNPSIYDSFIKKVEMELQYI